MQLGSDGYTYIPYTDTRIVAKVHQGRSVETFHNLMDAIGLIPVIGEVADGLNAVTYALPGDFVNASLSSAAMVPFLGWGATGAKVARRLFQKHHVIPNAVYRRFGTELSSIGWLQNAGLNLKKLPFPFHENHPAYNNYVAKQIETLKATGMLNASSMNNLQHQLRQEINNIYLGGNYQKLNDFYKALGY